MNKPFNALQAISGLPTVFDGHPAQYLCTTDNQCDGKSYWFKVKVNSGADDAVIPFYEDGRNRMNSMILYMKPRELTYWVASGKSELNGNTYLSAAMDSEASAISSLEEHINLDKTTLQTHSFIRYE